MIDWSSHILKPTYRDVTYSYQEAILGFSKVLAVVSIFAVISTVISVIIGVRKKDCIAILVVNIMVKTAIVFLYKLLDYLLVLLFDLDYWLALDIRYKRGDGAIIAILKRMITIPYDYLNYLFDAENYILEVLLFIVAIIIEGLIYKKVLQHKKHTGVKVSTICNISTVMLVTGVILVLNELEDLLYGPS